MRITDARWCAAARRTLSAAALTLFCVGAGAQQGDSTAGPAVLFVVDATNTLWGFDADARLVASAPVSAEIGRLNGALAPAMGMVYAVIDRTAERGGGEWVVAFDARTLKQRFLHRGAFTIPPPDGDAAPLTPGAYRSFAYDDDAQRFFVATDGAGVLTFDRVGGYVPGASAPQGALSSVARGRSPVLWLVTARHDLVRHAAGEGQADATLPRTGPLYAGGQGPVALAHCPPTGDEPAGVLAVASARAASSPARRTGLVQLVGEDGAPIGKRFAATITAPHAISCSSHRQVYVAADNGLLEFTPQGQPVAAHGDLGRLVAPVLGVLVTD